jgi:winged helix DNA-binding protein
MTQETASGEVLSQQALNRATLARQALLARTEMPALEMIEHLVGMQAQVPRAPYLGLWTRLEGFQADELAELMASRQAVRAPLMRATIDLTSARDAQILWPQMLPVLERNLLTGTSGSSALRTEMNVAQEKVAEVVGPVTGVTGTAAA